MSQSYTFENLHPTATQLLFLLNNTTYHGCIVAATNSNPLINYLLADYQFLQHQQEHFESLLNGITVPMICTPTIFIPNSQPTIDNPPTSWNETSPTGRLEYPP
uniref:Uncharacterized protein n=1 Tax=Moniliophthora roreri TaxID=221103 RepID=A0A0W0G6G2_MONRR